jgi:hypothetical protein
VQQEQQQQETAGAAVEGAASGVCVVRFQRLSRGGARAVP